MTEKKTHNGRRSSGLSPSYWAWGTVLIIVLLTAALRSRLLEAPLGRDEGEYAYAGQLLLQGVPPYAEVYNMKVPGIYGAFALMMAAFGETAAGIHLGLLLVNAATIVLLFLLGKRLYDDVTGVVASASFAVLSLSQSVEGVFANAEHFVIVFAVGGTLLLLRAIESDRPALLFWSGALMGLSFLMKQHGAAFVAFAALYLVWSRLRKRPVVRQRLGSHCAPLSIGVALPFGLTCLVLFLAGVFGTFWFWTFTYAWEYVSQLPPSIALEVLKRRVPEVVGPSMAIWILAGVGLTALAWDVEARRRGIFVAAFLAFSLLSICPGFYFRSHYFVLLLPAIALLAGAGVRSTGRLFAKTHSVTLMRGLPTVLAVIALLFPVYQQRVFLFRLTPPMASRAIYGPNPFPESLEIARYIRDHTSRNDRIAVIGSEPQIYFYAQRRSATGYIYTYPLVEKHRYALKMQQEMIREIESAKPAFLVVVDIPSSWLIEPDSEGLIFTWLVGYQAKYFYKVGMIDIPSSAPTIYKWGDESIGYSARSKFVVYIYERSKSFRPRSTSSSPLREKGREGPIITDLDRQAERGRTGRTSQVPLDASGTFPPSRVCRLHRPDFA